MNISSIPELPDVVLIQPDVHGDNRGYFLETWNRADFAKCGIHNDFCQDNESFSHYGTVRGLHFQKPPFEQAKLVRVIHGQVLDVAVDIRPNSPTCGIACAVLLDSESKKQLFIPRGFAHGFAVLSPIAIFAYKCDNPYHPEAEDGIKFNDPALNIDWRIPPDKMLLSPKDLKQPTWDQHRF